MAEDFSWIGGGGSFVGTKKKKKIPDTTVNTQLPTGVFNDLVYPTNTNTSKAPMQQGGLLGIPSQKTNTGMNTGTTPTSGGYVYKKNAPPVTTIAPTKETTFTQGQMDEYANKKVADAFKNFDFTDIFGKMKDLITPQQTQAPQYVDPYAQQTAEALGKYQTALNTPFQYDPTKDVGLQAAQQQAQQQTMREFARRNLMGSMSNEAQAQLAAMNLIPQYQQQARQGYNQNLANLAENLGLMQGLGKESYGRYRDTVGDINTANTQEYNRAMDIAQMALGQGNIEQNRLERQLGEFDKAYNPTTGQVELTPQGEAKRNESYINQMRGQGENFDYAGEIKRIGNNPSEQWKIPLLNQMRDEKVQQRLQTDIATIPQYYNDFQAEINRRTKLDPNDPLLPHLQIARAEKIANMEKAKLSKEEQNKKDALAMFKELGYATSDIAKTLGIPEGSQTADYKETIADIQNEQARINISKQTEQRLATTSKEKSMTATELKELRASQFTDLADTIKGLTYDEAVDELKNEQAYYTGLFGKEGYNDLWNITLRDKIREDLQLELDLIDEKAKLDAYVYKNANVLKRMEEIDKELNRLQTSGIKERK